MDDKSIQDHISALVDEEHRLREQPSGEDVTGKLRQLEEQLDQCWDLLRQRRARREFGQDPDGAEPRDISTVERYEQ